MTPPRWQRLRSLLNDVLERSPAEGAAFLDDACAGDDALRAEIDALLAAHDATGSIDDVHAALWPSDTPAAGRRIGAYRTVRLVGAGGMGAVFLAERDDDTFDQRVAIKVLHGGVESEEVRRRFLEERRILARLEHPGIARLFDGGITVDGRPYFVMEYVEGENIVEYCRARRLDVRRRLEIFAHVCVAVDYAHRSLVVHRDLKPSNILVTEDGSVKLLDFGIAKLIVPGDADAAPLTRTGRLWLTPEYASPEQIRGEPITTAADVYALGVVLFELLAGRRPYELSNATATEVERIICELEPSRPSRIAAETKSDDSIQFNVAQGQRYRRLTGDLDTIVLRALSKEPARRYAGAARLAEDVERHLAGLPIGARAPTFAYRAGKFVRRHRVALAAASVLALSVLAGTAGTAWQATRASQQARVAEVERDRARLEADKADQVSAFLVDLFQLADPAEARGEDITARELLDRGAARIRDELKQEPAVQAMLMDVIAKVYANLGMYDEGSALANESLTLRRARLGDTHLDVAASLTTVASLLEHQGRYDEAEPPFRQALEIRRTRLTEPHEDIATSLNNLGVLLHRRGNLAGAEEHHRAALEMRRLIRGDADPDVGDNLANLAAVVKARGRYEEADTLYRQALAIHRSVLGDDHPTVANDLNNLAVLLVARGDAQGAAPLLREAIDIRRKVLGPEHPNVAASLNNLAAVLERLGDLAGADSLYRQSLALKRAELGNEHPRVATSLNNLALLLQKKGELQPAESMLVESLEIRRRAYGEKHPAVASARLNLGVLLRDRGDLAAAEPHLRAALDLRWALLGETHPEAAVTAIALAVLHERRGDHAASEGLLREALAIRRAAFGDASWQTADVASALGACMSASGRGGEAEPLLVSAFERVGRAEQVPDIVADRVRQRLVEHFERTGQAALAARYRTAAFDARAAAVVR
ncbi:MAG: tetratricopeptide repeat protein [Longimicrobiales bacterium]